MFNNPVPGRELAEYLDWNETWDFLKENRP